MVSPAALSIITTSFPEGSERTRALGVWSAIAAGGGAFGLILGGILTDVASWQWVFFVNVPIGIAAFVLSMRLVPESRAEGVRGGVDVAGAVTVTGGLMLLVYAIVEAQSAGWLALRTLGLGAVALGLLAAFLVIELRFEPPLIRLGIFRNRSLAGANTAMLLAAGGLFAMFFFASLYVQGILGYSPLRAGFAFLPVTAGIMAGAGAAQGLIRRAGVRAVALTGMVVATAGLLLLTRLTAGGSYLADLLPGLLVMAVGMGLVFVPITLLATSNVEEADAGLASGLLNTAQQVGGALGLAVLSTLATQHTTGALSALHHAPSVAEQASALVSGFHVAFVAAALLMGAAAVLLATMVRG
ncbi:MAG: MFS transporter, partial [Candidatus Dormibacteria bacterium]